MKLSSHVLKGLKLGYRIIFTIVSCSILYLLLQVFIFTLFRIPSESMSPELIKGDLVVVLKPIVGPRIFNVFASMHGVQFKINRIPGLRNIQRNDVLVFNYPYADWDIWDKIEMHMLKYNIKRCIAVPGDTLVIREGYYEVNNSDILVGNIESQRNLSLMEVSRLQRGLYNTFPFDSVISWNIRDFGPLYIPKKGDTVLLDRTNYLLYRRLIEWELNDSIYFKGNKVYMNNDIEIKQHCFLNNYYFMGGDNMTESIDSRYWGLVPESYIVGKAWRILKSKDSRTNKMRFDRIFKSIN